MDDWKEFELAVAKFYSALDPKADVKHDIKLLDIHSKKPRQRDVWIHKRILGHIDLRILVSCKKHKRKIGSPEMDAFNGELISSGATNGVIYSYSGFTAPAIEKAKVLSISCCKIYDNAPPDIPEILLFPSYACYPSFKLSINKEAHEELGDLTFGELFKDQFQDNKTILEKFVALYQQGEKQSIEKALKSASFPDSWEGTLSFKYGDENEFVNVSLSILGFWRIYRAKMEAHLIDGTYSFTNSAFIGKQMTPAIDLRSSAPGQGWDLVKLDDVGATQSLAKIILRGGNLEETILDKFGEIQIMNMT